MNDWENHRCIIATTWVEFILACMGPIRSNFFLSRAKNCLLPTMVNLDIKGIPVNLSCPIYLQTIRRNNQSSPATNGFIKKQKESLYKWCLLL